MRETLTYPHSLQHCPNAEPAQVKPVEEPHVPSGLARELRAKTPLGARMSDESITKSG